MNQIDANDVIARRDTVLANELSEDEIVMLDMDRGLYFGVRDVAKVIWAALETPTTIDALCADLQEKFEVDPETCHRDVTAFAERLLEIELIDVQPAPRSS